MSDTVEPGLGSLDVRMITQSEVARFNELLDQHHNLGHHLVGRVLRYVACEDDEWVALLGFGSPALSLRPREDFIGWSEQAKSRRLRFVSNNQRFCVLGDRRRKNLASAVLSRTLKRVSEDAEAADGDPVLLVETFTDPERVKPFETSPQDFFCRSVWILGLLIQATVGSFGRRDMLPAGSRRVCDPASTHPERHRNSSDRIHTSAKRSKLGSVRESPSTSSLVPTAPGL